MIIDFHIHLGTPEQWNPAVLEFWNQFHKDPGFVDVLTEPQRLSNFLKEEGVDYAVALAEINPLCTGVVPNEYVAEFCRGIDSLIPFANIPILWWPQLRSWKCT